MNLSAINHAADNIRVLAASMVEKAKSGHPGGAMGGADFVNVLYSQFLVTDPDDGKWLGRDRFFLDPGHMSPMLYSVLALFGHYTLAELEQFRQWGSPTPGHPELHPERGVENTSGPLGQGHTMAVGCAIAERFMAARFGEWMSHKTYAFISDGGIQEEISQGAGRLAGYLGLHNLIMFYDSNRVQLSTMVDAVDREDVAAKYRAWHWNVIEINGNDPQEIAQAIIAAQGEKERPTLIIGNTVMGRGVVKADGSNFEGQCSTHGQPLSASGADYAATMKNLGADPENPWVIFDDVKALYDERRRELREIVKAKRAEQAAWEAANPELAKELHTFLDNKLPEIDWKAIPHKPGIASRQASADVLGVLAEKVNNMIAVSYTHLDQSLRRMKLDYVDLYYSHRFDPETPLEETLQALVDIVRQGKALYVGISRWPAEAARKAYSYLAERDVRCLIYQGRYNMLDRADEAGGIISEAADNGVGYIAFSPLAQGLLTDRYLNGIPEDSRIALGGHLKSNSLTPGLLESVRKLNGLAAERGQSLAEMALAWILRDRKVTSVIVGASSTSQLQRNLSALESPAFSDDELQIIDSTNP